MQHLADFRLRHKQIITKRQKRSTSDAGVPIIQTCEPTAQLATPADLTTYVQLAPRTHRGQPSPKLANGAEPTTKTTPTYARPARSRSRPRCALPRRPTPNARASDDWTTDLPLGPIRKSPGFDLLFTESEPTPRLTTLPQTTARPRLVSEEASRVMAQPTAVNTQVAI